MISRMKAQHDYWNTIIEAHVASLTNGKTKHAAMLTPEQMKKRREAQAAREEKQQNADPY